MRVVSSGPNGEGLVVYLILEDQRRVAVLRLTWLGRDRSRMGRSGGRLSYGGPMAGFEYLGDGPKATGSGLGWRMSALLAARCTSCDYYMSLDADTTDSCTCGALHKDADAGRFGSRLGDQAIEIYRRSD